MAIIAPVITAYFDLTTQGGDFFTIEHPTLGALDTGGVLAGDISTTTVTGAGFTIAINRGRDYELDEIPAGTCRIGWRNFDRAFDPSYTTGPYFGNIVPGKRVAVSIYGVTIFDGAADDWEDTYTSTLASEATVLCVDALGLLARKDFDEWTTTVDQLPGARIASVLARNEVVYEGGLDLDAGVEQLQADLVTWGSNVLNYLQLVAHSDLGRLFASREGVLTYRDRLSVSSATPRFTFADDGTGYEFHGVAKRTAGERLFTWVSVDREGGIAQSASDAAAVEQYGVRRLSIGGLLLKTDTRSADMADFLLGVFKTPRDRIAALTINVSGYTSEADQAAVASLEIGDVIRLVWTPLNVGNTVDNVYVVDGVAHQIAVDGAHVMTLALSEMLQQSLFVIEDPILGALDTGGVLAF